MNNIPKGLLTTLVVVVVVALLAVAALQIARVTNVLTENKNLGLDINDKSRPDHSITLSADASVTVVPDIAKVNLSIIETGKDVGTIQKTATDKINKLTKELKEIGILEKDIRTSQYNLYPQYSWDSQGKRNFQGYELSETIEVKIRNLDTVGKVLTTATNAGINTIGDLNFSVDEPEKFESEAREKALLKAKEKAESLAKVAGVKLGKIINFSESSNQPGPMPYYSKAMEAGFGGADVATPNINPGTQELTMSVYVTFEIE